MFLSEFHPPTRIVLASPAKPLLPISILLLPVVRFTPAFEPMAILDEPVILLARALVPVTRVVVPGCDESFSAGQRRVRLPSARVCVRTYLENQRKVL